MESLEEGHVPQFGGLQAAAKGLLYANLGALIGTTLDRLQGRVERGVSFKRLLLDTTIHTLLVGFLMSQLEEYVGSMFTFDAPDTSPWLGFMAIYATSPNYVERLKLLHQKIFS
jgi:hypothetical protein